MAVVAAFLLLFFFFFYRHPSRIHQKCMVYTRITRRRMHIKTHTHAHIPITYYTFQSTRARLSTYETKRDTFHAFLKKKKNILCVQRQPVRRELITLHYILAVECGRSTEIPKRDCISLYMCIVFVPPSPHIPPPVFKDGQSLK